MGESLFLPDVKLQPNGVSNGNGKGKSQNGTLKNLIVVVHLVDHHHATNGCLVGFVVGVFTFLPIHESFLPSRSPLAAANYYGRPLCDSAPRSAVPKMLLLHDHRPQTASAAGGAVQKKKSIIWMLWSTRPDDNGSRMLVSSSTAVRSFVWTTEMQTIRPAKSRFL
jgi:hypothetical protein